MLDADMIRINKVQINGLWVCARPLKAPFWMRIKDAFYVLIGKADAVSFFNQ
jgi:hypothetical protein